MEEGQLTDYRERVRGQIDRRQPRDILGFAMQNDGSTVIPNTHVRPIFIVGNPRSGTTMLRLILTAHPKLVLPHECQFMIGFFSYDAHRTDWDDRQIDDFCDRLWKYPKFADWKLNRASLERRLKALSARTYANIVDAVYRECAQSQGEEAARWGDKNPYYVISLPQIIALFPKAKIIHLLRDGRASASSMIRTRLGTIELVDGARIYQSDAYGAALMYRKLLPRGRRDGRCLGSERYYEVRYEDMVQHPESTCRAICEFIEEPYAPEMLNYYRLNREKELVPREKVQRFHRLTVQPPVADRANAWVSELSRGDLLVYEHIAGDVLAEFGYPPRITRTTIHDKLYLTWVMVTRPIVRKVRPVFSRVKRSLAGTVGKSRRKAAR